MKTPLIKRKVFNLFLTIGILCVLGFLAYLWIDSLRGPRLEELHAEDIGSIQFDSYNFATDQKQTVICDDQGLVREFVAMLQTAKEGTPHKCASPIMITINYKNRKPYRFDSLPGHHEEYYEFGMRQVYRVERQPYIKLLEKMGLKQVPTKCG